MNNRHTPVERTLNIRTPNVQPGQRVFLLVGIDPGKNTGFAIWNARAHRLQTVTTLSFWQCIERLGAMAEARNTRVMNGGDPITPGAPEYGLPFAVFIENTKGNSFMYARHAGKGFQSKIARNVGMNQRDSELIAEYCDIKSIPFFPITPTKQSKTGLKSELFATITGYKQRTNEHGRDAAMLVFDRPELLIVQPVK